MARSQTAKLRRARLKPWRIDDVVDGRKLRVQLSTAAQSMRGDEHGLRKTALDLFKGALFRGRLIAQERLEAGAGGNDCAALLSAVQDEVLSALYDYTLQHIFRVHNRTSAERLSICATGGYGRATLAPSSDIDLLFIRPVRDSSWAEGVIEYILYMLWDMGLKVGHASRTIAECLRAAKEDITIRTSVLEMRLVCGDLEPFEELSRRLKTQVFANTGQEFISAKMKERDSRHIRTGESRYMVEPNIKDGKGGLRDLQTLFWIAKYIYPNIEKPEDYINEGIFTKQQMSTFLESEEFLWTVRCHLHFLTGRPEERLTFDLQPEMARLMGYGDKGDNPAVERFMKHFFVITKQVGSLTRIMSAKLEADLMKKAPKGLGGLLPSKKKQKLLEDKRFSIFMGRIGFTFMEKVEEDPCSMLSLFIEAHKQGLDIDPASMAEVARLSQKCVDLPKNEEAKKLFLQIMEIEEGPFDILNLMNETGLLGLMVPQFGRIVGQTQFNMYHHYTVDEHTLHAVREICEIERGLHKEDLPLCTEVFPKIQNRRGLYLAMLLHDVGKGEGDQQILGAKAARIACKKFDVSDEETELVAWLVGHHLLMSDIAQKRDLGDPSTVSKFAEDVGSTEKLRLLLILTVADIRAVGPGIWNDWKAQLLRDLYKLTEATLRGGQTNISFVKDVLYAKARESKEKFLKDSNIAEWFENIDVSYWIGFNEEQLEWQISEVAKYVNHDSENWVSSRVGSKIIKNCGATEFMIITKDRRGLFAKLARVFDAHNANIVDARIYTSQKGLAFDIFSVHDINGHPYGISDPYAIEALETDLMNCLDNNEVIISKAVKPTKRRAAFQVEPFVLFDNESSTYDTIIEVSGADRQGLLADIAQNLQDEAINITSAHIGGSGERAEDAFYVRKIDGVKLLEPHRIERLKKLLEKTLGDYQIEAPTLVSKRKLAQARASTRR